MASVKNKLAFLFLLALAWSSDLGAQSLQITTPTSGFTFAPGDTITVAVNVQGTSFLSIAVVGEDIGISRSLTSPPYVFSFIAPNEKIGPKQLKAVGLTTSGAGVFSSPVTINVESQATLLTLKTNFTWLKFQYVGETVPLFVGGTFSDGSAANITKSSRITYISENPGVVAVTADGKITAVGPGSTKVTVAYANLSQSLPISVPNSTRGDLDGDGDVDQDDLNILLGFLSTAANKPIDGRDLNNDGMIDEVDATILISLCTRASCATSSKGIAPSIAWPPPGTITYGTALSSAQLNATASVPGTFVYSPPPGALVGAGNHIIFVTFSPADSGSYVTSTATVKVQVNQATATVAMNTASLNQTYDGTPKSAMATTIPAGLAVSFTYNGYGMPSSNPGIYAVVATVNDPNYLGSTTGTLTISAAPPTTVSSLSGPQGTNGWYKGAVAVTLTATDTVGPAFIASTSYSIDGGSNIGYTSPFTVSGEGIHAIQFYSVDQARNVEMLKTITIKIDRTPPTIGSSRTPTPNTNGWNNSAVTVSFQCADALSGLAAGSPPAPTILSAEGAGQSVTGLCQDLAGNSSSATISGINLDKTPPTIGITTPVSVATYAANQSVNAAYSCTDGLSGVATCVGTVPTGSKIDTAPNGVSTPKTFTVNATDNAANPGSQSVSYVVSCHYVALGISPSTVSRGSTVKVTGTVMSCTNAAQTVSVKFTLTGPLGPKNCANTSTEMFTTPPFTIQPGTSQSVSFPFLIPKTACTGTFTTTSTTLVGGTPVDSTSATLTVK